MTIMTKTMTAEEQELAETEAWLDNLDPATTPAEDPVDLRALAAARDSLEQAERAVAAAVEVARANGRSWGQIGMILGVSKQAASQRYSGDPRPRKRPGPKKASSSAAGRVVKKDPASGRLVVKQAAKTKAGQVKKAAKARKAPVSSGARQS